MSLMDQENGFGLALIAAAIFGAGAGLLVAVLLIKLAGG